MFPRCTWWDTHPYAQNLVSRLSTRSWQKSPPGLPFKFSKMLIPLVLDLKTAAPLEVNWTNLPWKPPSQSWVGVRRCSCPSKRSSTVPERPIGNNALEWLCWSTKNVYVLMYHLEKRVQSALLSLWPQSWTSMAGPFGSLSGGAGRGRVQPPIL